MKAIIVFGLIITIHISSFGQVFTNESKERIFPYFSNCENQVVIEDGIFEEFSSDVIQKIFTNSLEGELNLYAYCVRKYSYGVILFLDVGYPDYEFSYLNAILVYENGYYKRQMIGLNGVLDEENNETETMFVNDSVIQVIQKKYDVDSNIELERNIQYFLVNEYRIKEISRGQYSLNRDFNETSEQILEKEYLIKLSKQDLDIMRNEIFADHGYKFKTKKWQDYFSDKEWYRPRYDDVTDSLSVIEKINVQLILEVSNR